MAKIKHIAIVTMDSEKLAKFYCDVFDMKILHASKSGATYITDGYINVALLPQSAEGKPNGLNHFGSRSMIRKTSPARWRRLASRRRVNGHAIGPMPKPAAAIPKAIISISLCTASRPWNTPPTGRKRMARRRKKKSTPNNPGRYTSNRTVAS